MGHFIDYHDRPYYSLNAYFKNTYGEKIYKIALDAGFSCPNRDGRLDSKGCIFCSEGGSGDFALSVSSLEYFRETVLFPAKKQLHKKGFSLFVAYFQAFTNTYGPVEYLEQVYRTALEDSEIIGISIATRPDCINEDVLSLLSSLQKEYSNKFIWVELGLQTIHEKTAHYIRRNYNLPCFQEAVDKLHACSIPIIVHVILGLPGESKEMMLETVRYVNSLPIFGIKLQLLHVLKYTDLASDYEDGLFHTLTLAQYIDIVISCIELLRENVVIHRLTGDGPKDLLIAPLWSTNKRNVLNSLHREMKRRNTRQGHIGGENDTGYFNLI